MGKIEQSILDSIEILLNKRVSQLDFIELDIRTPFSMLFQRIQMRPMIQMIKFMYRFLLAITRRQS